MPSILRPEIFVFPIIDSDFVLRCRYKYENPLHEHKYIEVLTSEGVPPKHISAGLLSCPRNYSAGCKEEHSSGSQGDWTAARLKPTLHYLERVGVPEIAVWPAAGWLDGTLSPAPQQLSL